MKLKIFALLAASLVSSAHAALVVTSLSTPIVLTPVSGASTGAGNIDFNNDSTVELEIFLTEALFAGEQSFLGAAIVTTGTGFVGARDSFGFFIADDLQVGDSVMTIPSGGASGTGEATLADDPFNATGSWNPGLDAYLGVVFPISGVDHAGYVHVVYDTSGGAGNETATIDGWAYESVPGAAATVQAIPEPSALLSLCLATLGLAVRRKR